VLWDKYFTIFSYKAKSLTIAHVFHAKPLSNYFYGLRFLEQYTAHKKCGTKESWEKYSQCGFVHAH